MWEVLVLFHFTEEKTEAQKGLLPSLIHSTGMGQAGIEPAVRLPSPHKCQLYPSWRQDMIPPMY